MMYTATWVKERSDREAYLYYNFRCVLKSERTLPENSLFARGLPTTGVHLTVGLSSVRSAPEKNWGFPGNELLENNPR